MSDPRDLRKRWNGLLSLFGSGGGRGGWAAPRLPSNFTRQPGGGISERRRGWGSVFQPSNVAGAGPLRAVDNGTSGSTMASADSPALNSWRGLQMKREKRARQASAGGFGALFRSAGEGELAKRAGDGVISDAEREQRRAAGRASAEARRNRAGGDDQPRAVPGGPKFSPTRRSIYSQYRPSEAPEAAPPVNPQIDPASVRYPEGTRLSFPERGYFALTALRPQVPAKLGQEGYTEIARWAGQATTDARPDIYERAATKGLIPGEGRRDNEPKLDPKAVRAAYNHARNLALHDVGLIAYDWRHSDEGVEAMKPLVPFMRYTRDSLQNVLLSGRPGEWAEFRREFGTPFKDGRTYQHDTRGQKAGEQKKAFERHLNFLKDKEGKAPRMADLGRIPPQRMRPAAVEKLAKAISPVLARWARGTKWNAAGLSESLGLGARQVMRPSAADTAGKATIGEMMYRTRSGGRSVAGVDAYLRRSLVLKPNRMGARGIRQHELGHVADHLMPRRLLNQRSVVENLRRFDLGHVQDNPSYAARRAGDEERLAAAYQVLAGRHHHFRRAYAANADILRPVARPLRLGALRAGFMHKRWGADLHPGAAEEAASLLGASSAVGHLPRAIRRELPGRGLLGKRYHANAAAAAAPARLRKADDVGIESPERAAARRARMAARAAEREARWAQPGYLQQARADWDRRVIAARAARGEQADGRLSAEQTRAIRDRARQWNAEGDVPRRTAAEQEAWVESRRMGGPRPLTDAELEQRRAAARSPRRGAIPGRMPEGLAARLASPAMPTRRGAGVMTVPQAPARHLGPGRVAAAMAGGALIGGLGVTGWHAWQRRKSNVMQPA